MKKLYKAGFGEHWHFVAADDVPEAITKVRVIDQSFTYLPAVAEEVKEETGFIIGCLHPDELTEDEPKVEEYESVIETVEEVEDVEAVEVTEEPAKVIVGTCKKCGSEFENKGEFLAHARKCGKEV
jgi:hypothetical protein